MKNKILVELFVPEIEESYNIYVPVTKKIGNVINLLVKGLQEMTNSQFTYNEYRGLYNGDTGIKYDANDLIYNTDIRNGTKIILM